MACYAMDGYTSPARASDLNRVERIMEQTMMAGELVERLLILEVWDPLDIADRDTIDELLVVVGHPVGQLDFADWLGSAAVAGGCTMQADKDRIDELRALSAEQRGALDALMDRKSIHDPDWRGEPGALLDPDTATKNELIQLLRQAAADE